MQCCRSGSTRIHFRKRILFFEKSLFCLIHMNNKLINDKKIVLIIRYILKLHLVGVGSRSTFSKGSADPDSDQNEVDPQHCYYGYAHNTCSHSIKTPLIPLQNVGNILQACLGVLVETLIKLHCHLLRERTVINSFFNIIENKKDKDTSTTHKKKKKHL